MSVRSTVRRGRKIWHVEVRRRGYHRRRFLPRDKFLKRDAVAIEAQMLEEASRPREENLCTNNELSSFASTPAVLTFGQFAEEFLQLQEPTPDLRNKARNLRLHLLPALCDTPLQEIDRLVVDRLKSRLRNKQVSRRTNRKLHPKTINNILTTLLTILRVAVDYSLLAAAPRVKMVPLPKDDPVFMTREEADTLILRAPEKWRPLIRTAILTGLRRAELIELRWGDVDLSTARIRVRRAVETIGQTYSIKSTKGKRARTVPICQELKAVLQQHRPEGATASDLVFTEDGGGYLKQRRLYDLVKSASSGMAKKITPHICRHTFASWAFQNGVPPQVVQKWLGHANISTTERYAHLMPNSGDEFIEMLGQRCVNPTCEKLTNTLTNTQNEERRLE